MPGGYNTPEPGFLWKPESDGGGGLVVLLPSKYRNSHVRILDPSGNVIEEGRSSGYANGDREHFRFSQSGGGYPDGSIVEVTLADGSVMRYQVNDTSSRIDPGGGTGGGDSEGASGAAASYLSSPTNLNIQKPNVADKFAASRQQKKQSFKAPLSNLETIRSASNIIVGATKSYDSMMQLVKSEEVTAGGENLPEPEFKVELVAIKNKDSSVALPDFKVKYPEDATSEQISEFESGLNPWHSRMGESIVFNEDEDERWR